MRDTNEQLKRRHLKFGWYSLLVFLTLGICLEGLHGFKADFYLNVDNETRRLMWRLAHAHGTLLALVNIVFAVSVTELQTQAKQLQLASSCFIVSALLLPLGFLGAGAFAHGGDPGMMVLLVPLAALLLFTAVLTVARLT
jgi:hypothetical protein